MKYSNIHSLILSAGLSGRMVKFKPLAEYNGKTFINNIILKLDQVCDKIIVVTGFNSDELMERLIGEIKQFDQTELVKKISFVHNDNYENGMFTSLQKGLTQARECEWVLYHLVDQPGLPEEFYKEFVEQIDDKIIGSNQK